MTVAEQIGGGAIKNIKELLMKIKLINSIIGAIATIQEYKNYRMSKLNAINFIKLMKSNDMVGAGQS